MTTKSQEVARHYRFVHEPERCIKCYACEVACKQWHDIPAGSAGLRRVYERTQGLFPDVTRIFLSVACRHCAKPQCVPACPTGALTKDDEDGIVSVDATLCNGCSLCLAACPFDIPRLSADGIVRLCDRCRDRLAEGKNPICNDACPTKALRWEPHRGHAEWSHDETAEAQANAETGDTGLYGEQKIRVKINDAGTWQLRLPTKDRNTPMGNLKEIMP
jgi:anaerobic dimethyl sulfoxide reductase subunit B (iron-sulfur subunit)